MSFKKSAYILAAGMLILSILACNLGGGTPSGTDDQQTNNTESPQQTKAQPNATEAPAGGSSASGACANPYLPVVQGATWNYSLTGPTPDTYTRSIVSVDANGFTDQDVFGTGVTRQGKWSCDNGTLTALDPTGGTSGSVNAQNVSADFQTTASSGVTLPASINQGDSWTQAVTIEGIEDINGQQIPAKNEFTNNCTAAGMESVTVAAGTFNALRMDCQTTTNITVTMNGNPIETPLNFTTTNWYAENVGLVKIATSGSDLDSVTELTAYSIP